jgi:hypothetical protein
MTNVLFAAALYPGLVSVIVLVAVTAVLGGERPVLRLVFQRGSRPGFDALVNAASMVMATAAVIVAPWPLHPAQGDSVVGDLLVLFFCLEAASLLPVLAGTITRSPLAMRAASRTLQLGVAGRAIIWLAIGATAVDVGDGPEYWAARVLLAVASVLALPAALGVGPFAVEWGLTPAGMEEGLGAGEAERARLARLTRNAAMIAVTLVYLVPRDVPIVSVGVIIACFLVLTMVFSRLTTLPRFPLPAGLRWCWFVAAPPAVLATVWLAWLAVQQ